MKPSHLTTPRTLADCTFTHGYTSHGMSGRPTLGEFLVQAAIGLMVIAGLVTWVLNA